MAGSQFETVVPTMQQAANHVDEVQSQLVALLNGYWSRNEPIIGGSAWQGMGQTSFSALAAEWNAGFTKINQALDAIGEQILVSSGKYNLSDQDTHTDFGALQGSVS